MEMLEKAAIEVRSIAVTFARCEHEVEPIYHMFMNLIWIGATYGHQSAKRALDLSKKVDDILQKIRDSRSEMAASVILAHRVENHNHESFQSMLNQNQDHEQHKKWKN